MKIKKVMLKRFTRFTDLTVEGLPPTAKLIILAGPNGCGKSSFFDGLHIWHSIGWSGRGVGWQADYHTKQAEGPALQWHQAIAVEFHREQPTDAAERKKPSTSAPPTEMTRSSRSAKCNEWNQCWMKQEFTALSMMTLPSDEITGVLQPRGLRIYTKSKIHRQRFGNIVKGRYAKYEKLCFVSFPTSR